MTENGLTKEDVLKIQSVFKKHKQIERVILYGSRAMGTHQPFSDIDLTVMGQNIDSTQLHEIENQLDDLYLPYMIDLSLFNKIENIDLLSHIQRVGKEFYVAD